MGFSFFRSPKPLPAVEQTYGWGKHGSNRWHYIPSPAEIRRQCALIRERWDEVTERERRSRVVV